MTIHGKCGRTTGMLIASRAENADFSFLSAKISVFQRPKGVLYGREFLFMKA
jgi:hypothetical protein